MSRFATDTTWRRRLRSIGSDVREILFPQADDGLSQDKEWAEVVVGDERRRIRFHDYHEIFRVPGLYEKIFYDQLECCSPSYLVRLLEDVMDEYEVELNDFRVFDVGAGNGMVGDELRERGVSTIVGLDILSDARKAALRDREDVYADYHIADLTDLPEEVEKRIRRHRLNCLASVAALGFGDIPPLAFARALDLIEVPGWIVFNIKEDFLRDGDSSGFGRLIQRLNRDGYIRTYCYRRYRHRLGISGEKLHYVAVVAKKNRDIDDELLEEIEQEQSV